MSVAVDLEELAAKVAEHGPVAFLVTVGDDGRPHVVSVAVEVRDGDGSLLAGAGRTTSANVAARPDVTMLWPPVDGGDYSLIVDGRAEVEADAERLALTPVRAVLHRVADASGNGPGCITVLDRR